MGQATAQWVGRIEKKLTRVIARHVEAIIASLWGLEVSVKDLTILLGPFLRHLKDELVGRLLKRMSLSDKISEAHTSTIIDRVVYLSADTWLASLGDTVDRCSRSCSGYAHELLHR